MTSSQVQMNQAQQESKPPHPFSPRQQWWAAGRCCHRARWPQSQPRQRPQTPLPTARPSPALNRPSKKMPQASQARCRQQQSTLPRQQTAPRRARSHGGRAGRTKRRAQPRSPARPRGPLRLKCHWLCLQTPLFHPQPHPGRPHPTARRSMFPKQRRLTHNARG